jgi:hypothetical protein
MAIRHFLPAGQRQIQVTGKASNKVFTPHAAVSSWNAYAFPLPAPRSALPAEYRECRFSRSDHKKDYTRRLMKKDSAPPGCVTLPQYLRVAVTRGQPG